MPPGFSTGVSSVVPSTSASHQMALGLNPATSAIQAASVASTAGCDYASFSQFDPHMEGPPNASALGMIHTLL